VPDNRKHKIDQDYVAAIAKFDLRKSEVVLSPIEHERQIWIFIATGLRLITSTGLSWALLTMGSFVVMGVGHGELAMYELGTLKISSLSNMLLRNLVAACFVSISLGVLSGFRIFGYRALRLEKLQDLWDQVLVELGNKSEVIELSEYSSPSHSRMAG